MVSQRMSQVRKDSPMKTLATLCFLFLLVPRAFSQSAAGDTQFAAILPSFQGVIMQYSFSIAPFGSSWLPLGHIKKFNFAGTNVAQMQTVGGVTELYMSDSHDICGPKAGPTGSCSYLGTLSGGMTVTTISIESGGSYEHVTGTFSGLFLDDDGNQFAYTPALLSFDTYPAKDGINVPSAGSLMVVLAYN
jgi:hypothetical protein